jgi:hypothetical protein
MGDLGDGLCAVNGRGGALSGTVHFQGFKGGQCLDHIGRFLHRQFVGRHLLPLFGVALPAGSPAGRTRFLEWMGVCWSCSRCFLFPEACFEGFTLLLGCTSGAARYLVLRRMQIPRLGRVADARVALWMLASSCVFPQLLGSPSAPITTMQCL